MIVKSSEPLPNGMVKFKKLYWIILICFIAEIVITPLLGFAILGLMAIYTIDYYLVRIKRNNLRGIKFKLAENVNDEDLFIKMQSIFVSKYNMLVVKGENKNMVLTYDGHMYDILINDDNTFNIWWSMTITKAFLSLNNYKSYRKILAAMGIISYEIQNAYQVQ